MSARRRVVVTGLGSVSAAGCGGSSAVAAALERSAETIGPLKAFTVPDCASRLAAEVDDEELMTLLNADTVRRLSRICRMAVAACRLAAEDAGLEGGARLGLSVGSEYGDFRSGAEFFNGFLRRGPGGLSPMIFPNTVMNSMAAVVAIATGAKAPSVTINQATVAGDLAVLRGAALIASGRADAVIAGGVDEIFLDVYRGLCALGALSPMAGGAREGCRPYSADHNGLVIGEGATFLVLEEREAARARGARIMAEIAETAWGNVPTAPHTGGARRADVDSPVARLLRARGPERFERCYGAGNGDPAVDDWEHALLTRDFAAARPGLVPPVALAPLFGQHGGLGALRVGAAALDAERGAGSVLVHGIARGGCRIALVVEPPR
jgi:3-oxoacyl-[acyl-carrier-protein] synthase II